MIHVFNIPAITWTLTAALLWTLAPSTMLAQIAVLAGHAATGRVPAARTASQTSI
ncbi:hypothetical protein [Arthrobacter sp. MA-N2]|uniref:hypothetical protein n=1 Tax=Arthrobacter sp. MA-N2 TaxID=1101188 RepID=UPI0004B7D779|nr:hypothetical protein [Arthrobacter sp. MA-N2]